MITDCPVCKSKNVVPSQARMEFKCFDCGHIYSYVDIMTRDTHEIFKQVKEVIHEVYGKDKKEEL